jgi:hypothetical protein
VVLHHAFHIKIFYADDLVLARQLMCDLMLKIVSYVSCFFVFFFGSVLSLFPICLSDAAARFGRVTALGGVESERIYVIY